MVMMAKFVPDEWSHCSDQQADVMRWMFEDTGCLEVRARAGCGKTYLIEQMVKAAVKYKLGSVAAMAFNKPIAKVLDGRFKKSGYDFREALASTMHSAGLASWRRVAPDVKIDENDFGNQKMERILADLSGGVEESIYAVESEVILELVSLAKQTAIGVGRYVETGASSHIEDDGEWLRLWDHFGLENLVQGGAPADRVIRAAQAAYKVSLELCRTSIDFDDMLLAPLYFKSPIYKKDWVILDEAQDTNRARRLFALAMLKYNGRMVFVGDPAQAIFGFAGADSKSMDLLNKATNAKVLPLNKTRRCPRAVVNEARAIVEDFVALDDAPDGVVREITCHDIASQNLTKHDVILCRNTAPLVEVAFELLKANIPCRIKGRDMAQSITKLNHNLSQSPSVKTLGDLLEALAVFQDMELSRLTAQKKNPAFLVDKCQCLRAVILGCQSRGDTELASVDEAIDRLFGNTKDGEEPDVLILGTIHGAKGLEWDRVFLYGNDALMPSKYATKPWELEQEDNLKYVGITRAKQELIYVPLVAQKEAHDRAELLTGRDAEAEGETAEGEQHAELSLQ